VSAMFTILNLHSLNFRADNCEDMVAWTRIGTRLRKMFRRLWEALKSPGRVAGVHFFLDEMEI